MSDMGMPRQGNNPADSGNGNANFDTTNMGSGNRDAWNRPIKQQNQSGGSGGQRSEDKQDGGNGNNDGIDDELIANIWNKVENKDDTNNNNGNNNNGGGNNNQPAPVDENARLQKYLTDNGLGGFELTDAEKEAASNGDYGPMNKRINDVIVNSHMKALSGAQTMIQKAVRDAVAEVTQKANANYAGHKNLDAMHAALPFTKEKHIAPVAASILQKSLDRGMDTEKAVKVVEAYFNDIGSRMNEGKVNSNRNGNFNSGDKKQNWLNILAPGN